MASEAAKHTPGPWAVLPQNLAGPMIVHEFETGKQMSPTGYRLIAHMLQRGNSLEADKANARLIAAAPDLLAALDGARVALRQAAYHAKNDILRADFNKRSDNIDAAIAKATN